MKYILILPVLFLLASCSKTNVNSRPPTDSTQVQQQQIINDTDYIIIDRDKHGLDSFIVEKDVLGGYSIEMDSISNNKFYFGLTYYINSISPSTYSSTNGGVQIFDYADEYYLSGAYFEGSTTVPIITITKDSSETISGTFSGMATFYGQINDPVPIRIDTVSGVFTHLRITQ